jgi:RND family efflux transporter MFP subunit
VSKFKVEDEPLLGAPDSRPPAQIPDSPGEEPLFEAFAPRPRPPLLRQRGVWVAVLVAVAGVAAILALMSLAGSFSGPESSLILYAVRRGDMALTVTERGNVESQDEVKILCEVDDIEGDGMHGTAILWIVPNGASVKKGDLLVELDTSHHTERLDRQILDTERARAEQIQAQVKYENQQTQNETNLAEAKLKVEIAELALKQFEDEDGGTFQIDLQDLELMIQEAEAGQLIERTNLEGVEQLYKLGYRSGGELAQARLSSLKAERQLATAIAKKKELVEYTYRKSRMELEGALASAKRALEQVERDNTALLAQSKAAMEAAVEALKKEEDRLQRYRGQIDKGKMYAPQDGMVAYSSAQSRWYRQEIRAGAAVRPQQPILTLPNLQRMQVKVSVHESVLDQVTQDLPATVVVDVFRDRSYPGTVRSVAVLPEQDDWMSSETKVYEAVVTIDEEVEQLKPGMTAVVDIHVAVLKDVLSVPVQAVVQVRGESWCYVSKGRGVERRTILLGATNDRFVEVRGGLETGELVVLNPSAILEGTEGEEGISPPGPEGPQRPGARRPARPAEEMTARADGISAGGGSADGGSADGGSAAAVVPGASGVPGAAAGLPAGAGEGRGGDPGSSRPGGLEEGRRAERRPRFDGAGRPEGAGGPEGAGRADGPRPDGPRGADRPGGRDGRSSPRGEQRPLDG